MNAIPSLNAASVGFGPGRGPGRGPGGPRQAGMEAAADVLGMDPKDMRAQLRSGSSLADLAAERDVSTDELKGAMVDAISAVAPAGAADLISGRIDAVIAGDAPGRTGRPDAPGPDMASALGDVASAFGVSTDELLAALDDGTFSDLIASRPASTGAIVDARF